MTSIEILAITEFLLLMFVSGLLSSRNRELTSEKEELMEINNELRIALGKYQMRQDKSDE